MANPGKIWTVGEILKFSSGYLRDKTGIESSKLDSELLLGEVLEMDRVHLFMNLDRPVSVEEREKFKSYLKRRIDGEPIAYITGRKNFWTSSFRVTRDTLIPRADTEVVLELALDYVNYSKGSFSCLDIGTGSGCLIVSLAKNIKEKVDKLKRSKEVKELASEEESENISSDTDKPQDSKEEGKEVEPSFYYEAWDISEPALEVARTNASEIIPSVDINFLIQDILTLPDSNNKFDLIISNPPYIEPGDPRVDSSTKYEPRVALFAKDLVFYKKIAQEAKKILDEQGVVVVEIGKDQKDRVVDIFSSEGFRLDKSLKDLAGIDRAVCFKK